jgi:hypothetical protein
MIVTMVAVPLVVPALALLHRLDLTARLAADHEEDLVQTGLRAPDRALGSAARSLIKQGGLAKRRSGSSMSVSVVSRRWSATRSEPRHLGFAF